MYLGGIDKFINDEVPSKDNRQGMLNMDLQREVGEPAGTSK
jgi:hypothetical protein